MENILLFLLLKAFLLMHCFVNSEPDMEACIDNYELSFYCVAIQFEKAKEACKKEGSYLVKIDNANMTETINDVLDRLNCPKKDFHAGATADSKRRWTWLDGSNVYLSGENGYQNWKQGQPNDFNKREDCLKIEKYTKQWYDSSCDGVVNGKPAEQRYYICQKNLTLSIDIKESNSNSIKCSATSGFCVNQVDWRRNDEIISSFQNHSVYQVLSSGSTVLYHENATIADEGKYSCTTGVRENKLNQVEAVATIKVNATPEIYKIDSLPCTNSLMIFWKPQPTALGFPHKIKVKNTMSGDQVKSIIVTPLKNVQRVTEISGLQPTTVYYIQISACKGENLCPREHNFNTTATTGGIIIKNATMYQMNDYGTCTVSWEWPYNITAVFKININPSSDETSRVNTSELNVFVNKTEFSYSFEPTPELIYKVQIQSTENPDFCPDPVKAVGSCTGEIKQTTAQTREFDATTISATSIPSKITGIVIPVSAAGGGFVLLIIILVVIYCKRSGESANDGSASEPNKTQDSSEYETVGDAEINAAYSTIGDQPSSHAAVYVNYGQNKNVSFENVKPNQDQLYEIPINRK